MLDLLQGLIGSESRKEAEAKKKKLGRREAARKEIELKNEFRKARKEEESKNKELKPGGKKQRTKTRR